MAKDLKYYKDLSNQLGKEIEILESSYQDFEKVIDVNNYDVERNDENQKEMLMQFAKFCKAEGFIKDEPFKYKKTYQKAKDAIIERVEFLKKQKEINDKMLSLHQDLNKLKKENTLSDVDVEELEKAKRIEETKESITKANEEVKKNKKENGLGKVVSSVFGPFGNKIYNAYAKVYNWDLKNYKKNKIGNIALKLGLGVGAIALLAAVGYTIGTTLAATLALGALGVTGYSIYKVVKKDAQLLPLKDTKKVSLKEAWKRFRKSRGKGELSVEKKLYNGISSGVVQEETRMNSETEAPEGERTNSEMEIQEETRMNSGAEIHEEERANSEAEKQVDESEKKYNNPKINPTFCKTLNLKNDFDERCGDRFSNVEDAKKAINDFLAIVDDYKNGKMFNNLENEDVATITHYLFSFVNAYVYFNIKNKSDEIININGNELKVGEVCKKIMQSGIPKDMLGIVNDYLSMHKRIENKINKDNEKNQKGK